MRPKDLHQTAPPNAVLLYFEMTSLKLAKTNCTNIKYHTLSWFKNCQILPGDLLDQNSLGQIILQLGMEASTFGGSAIPEKDAEVDPC